MRAGCRRAVELLAAADPRGAELLEEAPPSALACLGFPCEHDVWVRTNNVCEWMNCEVKRRTRVMQVFPSRGSLVRLVGAVCCDQNDAWLSTTNFINPRTLAEGYEREPLPGEPGGVERVLRLVGEAFDSKLGAAWDWRGGSPSREGPYTTFRDATRTRTNSA